MGNMLGRTSQQRLSVQMNGQEVLQEDRLMSELSGLPAVDLWRVHWGLSQDHLQDFPPVPPRWLWTADTVGTTKILLQCYQQEGALTVLAEVLALIGREGQVYNLCRSHSPVPPRPGPSPRPGPDFVRMQRRKLISRMQRPQVVLNVLQQHGFLKTSHSEAINIYALRKHKNRVLVDLVLRNGDKAQEVFYQVLSQSEPFLLQELDHDPIRDKHASETSVLTEMLECLVSDELRAFQWLVSDHLSGESCPPIGGEQLEHANRLTTWRLLEKHFGPEQAENVARNVLLKIVLPHSLPLRGEAVTSESSFVSREETEANTTPVEITPEVHKDGDMFRLRCLQPGVFRCLETGLLLEGFGDVVYQTVPWDVDFLSSKGLRPAGPLFRFTLLTGSFHRLHLPHCQLLSDGGQDLLRVAHATEDRVDFLTPGKVTGGHVVVDVSGFSCFGLVMPAASGDAISGLVLLFSRLSDNVMLNSSLYVLLLPRNVVITQVMKEWKRRIGAEYVEALPECELIPNQTYELDGQPVTVVQPESAKFVNFNDYNNFLPSFEVQLEAEVRRVELKLRTKVSLIHLIGWLLGSTQCAVWSRVVQLKGVSSAVCAAVGVSDSLEVTFLLLNMLNSLRSDDLKTFKHLLSLQSDPIPLSRLEAADIARTVDLMVQKYQNEGAKQVAQDILRRMDQNQLADHLHNT
ncbi:uncharacterized protein LOC121900682 [Thunnus maccoyii]|uniref:uncharacterized protein LOC121900682 n=1 Tax=Thunnus maccoyii TaxID=8240 RepID=UPI001C4AA6BD|nr:uncharacterized protein LOC121900682 [Thunnus maccoyii]XP_042273101.1 uncharacterized protein LOC121900682 [Thunnus maccoyii]